MLSIWLLKLGLLKQELGAGDETLLFMAVAETVRPHKGEDKQAVQAWSEKYQTCFRDQENC